jgi:hypothetical protein
MRRWRAWTRASTCGQGMSDHDVTSGASMLVLCLYPSGCPAPYWASLSHRKQCPRQPSSLVSLGFPQGVRFLGNPSLPTLVLAATPWAGESRQGYFVPLVHLPLHGGAPLSTGPAGWCRVSVKGLTHSLQRRTVTFVAGLRLLSSAVRPGFRHDGCRGSLGCSCATVLAVTSIRLRGIRRLASALPWPGALGRAEVRLCGRG